MEKTKKICIVRAKELEGEDVAYFVQREQTTPWEEVTEKN